VTASDGRTPRAYSWVPKDKASSDCRNRHQLLHLVGACVGKGILYAADASGLASEKWAEVSMGET